MSPLEWWPPILNVPQEIRLDSHELFVTLRRFVLVTEEGESNNSVNRVVYFFFQLFTFDCSCSSESWPKEINLLFSTDTFSLPRQREKCIDMIPRPASCMYSGKYSERSDEKPHMTSEHWLGCSTIEIRKLFNETSSAIRKFSELKHAVFEPRTDTGSVLFSYFTCLHTTPYIFLSLFALVETITWKSRRNQCLRLQNVHFRLPSVVKKRCMFKLAIN